MKDFSFHRGSPQPGAQYLFNQVEHLQLQARDGWQAFRANRISTGDLVILVHFHIQHATAHSPLSAPYGPVELTNANPELVLEFFTFVLDELRGMGVTLVVIKDTPSIFRPASAKILQVGLTHLGFQTTRSDIASTIVILPEPLSAQMADTKLKKLKKAMKANLEFRELPLQQLETVYQFIAMWRARKNYSISMTFDQLNATVQQFPQHFYLFGVFEDETMVAACVSVLISDEALYTFYAIHHEEYDSLNPSVLLIDGIYTFAQKRGLRFLDLGTSSNGSVTNFGILNFKREMGATQSSCLTYEKVLS